MADQPKVLFTGTAAGDTQSRPAQAPAPVVLFGGAAAPALASNGPKVVAGGVLRQRIPCSAVLLGALDPAASPAVLAKALRMVAGVNLDDSHFGDIAYFGAQLQAEHGAMAEVELAIANHASIQQAQGALADILAIFRRLDPAMLFPTRAPSFFEALRQRLMPPKRAGNLLFNEDYLQLRQRIGALKAHGDALDEAAGQLTALAPRYAALVDDLAAAVLAARFIVAHVHEIPAEHPLQAHYAAQASALETRVSSLLATRATLEMGHLTHRLLDQSLRALTSTTHGVVDEELPAFHTACTAALTSRHLSPEALAALQGVYERIIRTLKGEPS